MQHLSQRIDQFLVPPIKKIGEAARSFVDREGKSGDPVVASFNDIEPENDRAPCRSIHSGKPDAVTRDPTLRGEVIGNFSHLKRSMGCVATPMVRAARAAVTAARVHFPLPAR